MFSCPENEIHIFVDYGDENADFVFDHHGSEDDQCSTSIVCSEEGLQRLERVSRTPETGRFRIITHSSPDLDSVAATAVVVRSIQGRTQSLTRLLVEYIRAKDQGEPVNEDPECSVALIFQALKDRLNCDEDIMREGMKLVELVDTAIHYKSLDLSWSRLSDVSSIAGVFPEDVRALQLFSSTVTTLLSRSPKVLLSLPTCSRDLRWSEGILLDFLDWKAMPLGWKDYARSETRLSMFDEPVAFTAVRHSRLGRPNYVASVDSGSGLTLRGLGTYLDRREEEESRRLESQKGDWSPFLTSVAKARSTDAKDPSLLRKLESPRHGFSNSDPWYDGRGHGYTIIDTPDSGTVLTPDQVLRALLNMYGPQWKEQIVEDEALCLSYALPTGPIEQEADWLWSSLISWDGRVSRQARRIKPICLADAIDSVSCLSTEAMRRAVYLPVVPAPPQGLPKEQSDLHISLSLYQICHRLPSLLVSPPSIDTLETWLDSFSHRSLPGCWCAVSDSVGLVVIDYRRTEESRGIFQVYCHTFFELVTQMEWTNSLSPSVRRQERLSALAGYVEEISIAGRRS